MAFHALLVVRDEEDIIAETLEHLLAWADSASILDTGSTDGTWETIQAAAARDPRIIFAERHPCPFRDGLRAVLFDRVRSRFTAGDWIVRIDADEFFHIPPPQFVHEHIRWPESKVYFQLIDFVHTRSEADAWEQGLTRETERTTPLVERRRRYLVGLHPELRLFRFRRGLRWDPAHYEPSNAGLLARERIPVRHYRCRTPEQVRRRCALRTAMVASNPSAEHWRQEDWNKWIYPDDHPDLLTWPPGAPLPEHRPGPGIPRDARRLSQWLYYASGAVHLRDALRPRSTIPFPPA
jgi:hypothetical protein